MTTTHPGTATAQHAPAGHARRSVEPAREALVGALHVTAAAGLLAAVVVADRLPGRRPRT